MEKLPPFLLVILLLLLLLLVILLVCFFSLAQHGKEEGPRCTITANHRDDVRWGVASKDDCVGSERVRLVGVVVH